MIWCDRGMFVVLKIVGLDYDSCGGFYVLGNFNVIVYFFIFVVLFFKVIIKKIKIWFCELLFYCNWNVIIINKWIVCDVDKKF